MGEPLETFDDQGHPAGLVERAVIHATGLWHRAAHVWLFDGSGRVLLQRRLDTKDVCPGCWDLSVGEHLQPGEDYLQGATRGLAEELGIVGLMLEPLGGVRQMRLELPDVRIRDYELQQTFQARYDGAIAADPEEVAEVRFVTLAELGEELANRPGDFTPWASQDVEDLSLL
ncbi:MAG: NUDIX domain-containing protein [Halofilum sp. (in: g-proteobacteria)]